jgi:hypothetical protein
MSPFVGLGADEYNAMRQALRDAATHHGFSGEYAEYDFLAEIPRTSLSMALVNALHERGFSIRRHND